MIERLDVVAKHIRQKRQHWLRLRPQWVSLLFSATPLYSLLPACLLLGCVASPLQGRGVQHRLADTHAKLSVLYLQRGNMAQAQYHLHLASQTHIPTVHVLLAHALFDVRHNHNEKAEQGFQAALGLDQSSGEAHNNYGAFLFQQQRYAQAERQFLLATKDKTFPHVGQAYENAGLSALACSHRAQAARYFEHAALYQPNRVVVALWHLEWLLERGNDSALLAYLEQYSNKPTHYKQLLDKLVNLIASGRYGSRHCLLWRQLPASLKARMECKPYATQT